jgi:hypothetical protein
MIHGLADDRPRAPGRRSLLPAEEAPTCQCRRLGRGGPPRCCAPHPPAPRGGFGGPPPRPRCPRKEVGAVYVVLPARRVGHSRKANSRDRSSFGARGEQR